MTGLRAQIEAMTSAQKQALADRLGMRSTTESPQKGLHAYVVPEDATLDADTLRAEAQQRLPAHMVPDTIMILDQMPRRPNGKIDKQALPPPTQARASDKQVQTAATVPDDIETVLLDIWCDLLDTDYLEPTDNFFEFGGDSILAIQVIARARDAGLVMDPKQLLENPTVADLSSLVSWQEDASELTPTHSQGTAKALPVQQWFFGQDLAQPGHWNSARLLELQVDCSNAVLNAAIDTVLARHAGLRTKFTLKDGHWLQHETDLAADTLLETKALANLSPTAQAQALDHVKRGFDLTSDPLIRLTRFETAQGTNDQLLITAHHLVIDEVSWPILLEDLNLSILQIAEGQDPHSSLCVESFAKPT